MIRKWVLLRRSGCQRRTEAQMLGLENPLHIAIVLLVVLLVFGAKRLPEMGRSLGSGLRGFKESISGESSPEPAPVPAPSAAPAEQLPAGERAREVA
jgi:sec-independent protein translocase protein TatA